MNHFLLDLFPVLLFFIVFKFYGIYAATWVGILTTAVQALVCRYLKKEWDKMQLVTLGIFILFGGMTLYFHNPIFVKWKPTILFWLFGIVLLGSHFVGNKPLMQRMLESALSKQTPGTSLTLPNAVGKKVNLAWVVFFILLGTINLYVAYTFSDDIWVNFKLYGISVATLVFSLAQSIYLMKYFKI